MKRLCILSLSLVVLPACSGDNSTPNNNNPSDASVMDTSMPDDTGSTPSDAGTPLPDTGDGIAPQDATPPGDAGPDADAAVEPDGGDAAPDAGGCPSSWTMAPVVDTTIALPDGGGGVLLHAVGSGTQDYKCEGTPADGGAPYAWTLVTPAATLTDCHNALIGYHFASEAGAGFPEWQTTDGTYVIATKHLPTFTPDGGAGSIPWLLLHAVDAGGTGSLSMVDYIQRLNTDGGNAPADGCDLAHVGDTRNVPYAADYYFYGP